MGRIRVRHPHGRLAAAFALVMLAVSVLDVGAATCPPQPPTLLADTERHPGRDRPENLTGIGSTLYFTALTPAEGREL